MDKERNKSMGMIRQKEVYVDINKRHGYNTSVSQETKRSYNIDRVKQ